MAAAEDKRAEELRSFLEALRKGQLFDALVKGGIASLDQLVAAPSEALQQCLPPDEAASLNALLADTRELYALLQSRDKAEYYGTLLANNERTLEDICARHVEELPLPKMLARILQKKAKEAIKARELRAFLVNIGKEQYLEPLLKVLITSPEEICNSTAEVLSAAVGSKMGGRLLLKKAAEYCAKDTETKTLRPFLKECGKEQYFDSLVAADFKCPEDVRDASVEALSKAVGNKKMVGRILLKKAQELCPPAGPDVPDYKVKLTQEAKKAIREIWTSLRDARASFGERFYENLVKLDRSAVPCFAGVNFATVGREFDRLLDRFVANLGDEEAYGALSDELVARLMRYQVPCRSLWMGGAAWEFAAISVSPTLEMTHSMENWAKFYRAIIPGLHPTLLKAASLPTEDDMKQIEGDFMHKVEERFSRHGHLYLTLWMMRKEQIDFVDRLANAIRRLRDWQQGTGLWARFEEACSGLFSGMNEEMALEFGQVGCRAISDAYSARIGREFGIALRIILFSLYGMDSVTNSYRTVQREMVWEQWHDIYHFTAKDFGESFYDRFTQDPLVKESFESTDLKMQRVRFVHQLNSTLIRINEDPNDGLRPMLLQLGARHRVYYNISLKEMLRFNEHLLATVKEMLGKTGWKTEVADAWEYVTSIVVSYMLVGWTMGVSVLEEEMGGQSQGQKIEPFDRKALKAFRDSSKVEYGQFFSLFAEEIAAGGSSDNAKAASRYRRFVDGILDEQDESLTRDNLHAMGRRHTKYHGVSLEALASASPKWMSCAKSAFGKHFTSDVAKNFARLWELIATGMDTDYKGSNSTPSLEELTAPYAATDVPKKATVRQQIVLTLKEKEECPQDMAVLRFVASQPVKIKAGQFAKLRFTLPSGRTASRFYSVSSSPHPIKCTSETLDLFVKLVPNGKVSPFLVREMALGDSCELLTVAGGFTMPDPADGHNRLMVSAGVGLVAFMSVLRSIAGRVESDLVKKRITLALIHSERAHAFPFRDELLALSKKFAGHHLFSLDLTLCFTGKQTDRGGLEKLRDENPLVTLKSERVDRELLATTIRKFGEPSELPVYGCGPKGFQKMIRETILKQLGHRRSLMHLEFFDL